jgi:hypothetical protein
MEMKDKLFSLCGKNVIVSKTIIDHNDFITMKIKGILVEAFPYFAVDGITFSGKTVKNIVTGEISVIIL